MTDMPAVTNSTIPVLSTDIITKILHPIKDKACIIHHKKEQV
ncbi:hypothetical protein [uncultured Bacteroides sp.]|nr:hypothetical protein [uncultured Bacteroides sp.]